jgi:DNA replication protein DnaC
MLKAPTVEQLKSLALHSMAQAWEAQGEDVQVQQLSFDERFALLVEAEALARDNKRLARALREARLRISGACIEDIDFAARRELDRKLVLELATCRWVREHQHVVITGATGVGKTYLGCALAQKACRMGHRALYRRVPRLLEEFTLAHADGSYTRLLARLARADVLVLDDWGLAPLKDQERRDILEVVEDRDATRSTVIISQLPTSSWHDHLGDPTVADAICDRVLNRTHRLTIKGPSKRKETATGI